jgi:diphthine synthase
MTLHIIGIGLADEKDITVKGLEIVKRAKAVFLEGYTAVLSCGTDALIRMYGREVTIADREMVEKRADEIIDLARKEEVAFLVVGDPMSATTHLDLVLRAKEKGVSVEIVHNASILTSVGAVGLDLYKYGRTTTIVFPDPGWDVSSHYDVVKDNISRGLHTLCLLDIKVKEPAKEELRKAGSRADKPRFMTVNQGIASLLEVERRKEEGVFTEDTLCVGCARIGCESQMIIAGRAKELLSKEFGGPMHCLIVPGKLHFTEEDALRQWK